MVQQKNPGLSLHPNEQRVAQACRQLTGMGPIRSLHSLSTDLERLRSFCPHVTEFLRIKCFAGYHWITVRKNQNLYLDVAYLSMGHSHRQSHVTTVQNILILYV